MTLPEELAAAGDRTLGDTLRAAAERWGGHTGLVLDGARASFAALAEAAEATARGLAAMGLGPGDRLVILMANSLDYVRLVHGAAMLGAVAVTLNARFRDAELRHAILHADPRLIAVGGHALPHVDHPAALIAAFPALADWDGQRPPALAELPSLRGLLCLADPRGRHWPDEAALRQPGRLPAGPDPGQPALMMFSSGTTARPKACLVTHRQLGLVGAAFSRRFGLAPGQVVYNPLPFFHMSTMLPMAACRASGATQLCTRHFDPGEGLRTMAAERASFAYVSFPTVVGGLMAHPDFARTDLSTLRFVHSVGPAETLRKIAAAFPGTRLVNAYGLTEAAGVPVWSHPDDPPEASFVTSGRPLDGVEAKAVDPETLADLPAGARGEIWLRGWPVFPGYWRDPEASAAALRPDGWLRTGDLGHVDAAGRVVYDGRLKDMLKIGGENVAALEIESLLAEHPGIHIAQVIGVPDARLVEVAAAYVELVPGAELTAREVVAHCLGRIARFKVPRYVRFVTEWPMSATKIQKFRLSREFAAHERFDIRAMAAAADRGPED